MAQELCFIMLCAGLVGKTSTFGSVKVKKCRAGSDDLMWQQTGARSAGLISEA